MANPKIGIEIVSSSGPGIPHTTTGVIARHNGNIISVDIIAGREAGTDHTYFEIEAQGDPGPMLEDLRKLPIVRHADQVETMEKIYGKRIIIVAAGRKWKSPWGDSEPTPQHSCEHISIDTIPLVGSSR